MVVNSYVIHCSEVMELLSHKQYRLLLAEALMLSGRLPPVAEAKGRVPCPKRMKPNDPLPSQRLTGGLHALERLGKGKVCVQCKSANRVRMGCDVCQRAMHIECFRAWHTE